MARLFWSCFPGLSLKKRKRRKPQFVDQYHTFRSKTVRKPMPCDVCRQPIYSQGSCCRVCKYVCHKTCEPKVYSSCDTPLHFPLGAQHGNETLDKYSSNHAPFQLRKSQTFPAGRSPSDDYLHDRRDRSRFRPSTIEMDLTFITERIISMSFPMTGMDDSYCNSLQEVTKMLRTKHGKNYMIFNLSERRNDLSQLNSQVMQFGWPESLAPPLERLCSVCKAMDSWLSSDPQHVVVLHCKGGKERTAIVTAAFMHFSSICSSADQALDRFAMKRFYNDKLGGLSTPSYKRYVNYFSGALSGIFKINSSPLYLHQVLIHGVPNFDSQGGCKLFLKVYQGLKPVFTSGVYTVANNVRAVTISLETPIQLRGDILVKAYHRRTRPEGRDVVFRCQFHTCAVSEYALSFSKEDLDDAIDDNRFPEDGRVEMKFSSSPERQYGGIKELSVPVDNSSDAIVRCNSYENLEIVPEENPYDMAYIVAPELTVDHLTGPLDGSPYATVTKKGPQVNGFCNGGMHTASMDSGISSTTPPHSGQSSSSAGEGRTGNFVPNGHVAFETRAEVHHPSCPDTIGAANTEEQRKLDELLDGMLAQVETIPDLKPRTTTNTIKRVTYSPEISAFVNGDSGVGGGGGGGLNGDMDDTSESDVPYHARSRSQPFSYLVPGSSPTMARRAKTITITPTTTTTTTTTVITPVDHPGSRQPVEHSVPSYSSELLPPPPPPRESSPPVLKPLPTANLDLKYNSLPAASYYQDLAYDSDPNPISHGHYDIVDPNNWLRQQQQKLRDRQEAKVRGERYPKERLLINELRSAQSRIPRPPDSSDEEDFEIPSFDGLRLTDHQKPLYVNTYTNGYGQQQQQQQQHPHPPRGTQTLPPSSYYGRTSSRSPPPSSGKPPIYGRGGGSAPSSPLIPSRSSSRDATRHRYGTWQQGNSGPSSKQLVRQRSDTSYDRERPFVFVKRAHEMNNQNRARRPGASGDTFAAISSSPIYQNIPAAYNSQPSKVNDASPSVVTSSSSVPRQSPQSQGLLLTTVPKSGSEPPRTSSPIAGHLDELELSLQSIGPKRSPPQNGQDPFGNSYMWNNEGGQSNGQGSPHSPSGQGDRPATPGFPVLPRTPYSNQAPTPPPTTLQGLPPKSPPLSRKDRSPSPATVQQLRVGLSSTVDITPHTQSGGQSSPTVYYGQSRRSSLISLTEPVEVIHHHSMFVKDTSKYWYKPNISREDAINILKDKPPGTFLVRDSNSFPGAFGLALKVSSPPLNVQNKSGDISNELVRHFLIEPTNKGVKLKGCSNEPVFGSLSALVYQHSITPLALPCKLILPEVDPTGDILDLLDNGTQLSSQLLTQGAACNVLYLYTKDMESLTGPQAVRKTTALLLDQKPLPEPTVVHFKVSAQGITLTDNNRQLFFRRHYPINTISFCGLDPDDRRWTRPTEDTGAPVTSMRIFGYVARKPGSKTDNQCHVFAELEPEQPATAIVNFVTKVMMSGTSTTRSAII